jgi:hypothetical protein
MPGDVEHIFPHLTSDPAENAQQELRERRKELRECRNHVLSAPVNPVAIQANLGPNQS